MTEQELVCHEAWNSKRASSDSKTVIAKLIAEVRRLNAEVEGLKHELSSEKAYSSELRKQL